MASIHAASTFLRVNESIASVMPRCMSDSNRVRLQERRLRTRDSYAVPGLFMVMLAIGAAWGRLVGQLVAAALRRLDVTLAISMPAYAVVGAAGALGKLMRSLCLHVLPTQCHPITTCHQHSNRRQDAWITVQACKAIDVL